MKQLLRQLVNPRRITPYAILSGLVALALVYIPTFEIIRLPGIVTIAIWAATSVIWLEYCKDQNDAAAKRLDTLNGNILRIVDALNSIRKITNDEPIWDALPGWVKEDLVQVEDHLGNLAAKMQGFREYDEMRDRVLRDRKADNDE